MQEEPLSIRLLKNFISGGCGALLTDFVFYPLDTLKTRIQVASNQVKSNIPKKGLYKGISATMIVSFPCAGSYFLGYESMKHAIKIFGISV